MGIFTTQIRQKQRLMSDVETDEYLSEDNDDGALYDKMERIDCFNRESISNDEYDFDGKHNYFCEDSNGDLKNIGNKFGPIFTSLIQSYPSQP